MKFNRFKTFTTSYYFPELDYTHQYMYGLYSAYGGRLSRFYWWLFRKYRVVRRLTAIDENSLDFPYRLIRKIDGTDSLMSFNMGSPGVEQKISILGYDNMKGEPFFAKFSQKPAARNLTKNEIKVYRILDGTMLTPKLLGCSQGEDYDYLKAEYIPGSRPQTRELTEDVVRLCIMVSQHHLTENHTDASGLTMCLSHGDFCPWNILVSDKGMRLIDWELADDRPLGFDLFTYICQVSALFTPENTLLRSIDDKTKMIESYFSVFGIEDYLPYLRAFAEEKIGYERSKGNCRLLEKYEELFSMIQVCGSIK
ncbi:MAG: phosphotransferase [Prevotella sp.]|nr:phosphotransferase [Prevotella sp.]